MIVAGESGRDGPVPPDQGREEVIALLAVHIDRLSVVVLRSVELAERTADFRRRCCTPIPENRTLAPPRDAVSTIWPFFSPKLPVSAVSASGPASSGDLVMMLMVANMALLPYRAEEGPRMISICLIRFMSIGKSFPKYSM